MTDEPIACDANVGGVAPTEGEGSVRGSRGWLAGAQGLLVFTPLTGTAVGSAVGTVMGSAAGTVMGGALGGLVGGFVGYFVGKEGQVRGIDRRED